VLDVSQYALSLDTGGQSKRPVRTPWQAALMLFLLLPAFFLLVYNSYLWFSNYGFTEYCEQRPDIYDCGPVWPVLWRLGGEMLLALVLTVIAQLPIRRVPYVLAVVLQILAVGLLGHVIAGFIDPASPFEQFQGGLV
jgi:hypothetical protein